MTKKKKKNLTRKLKMHILFYHTLVILFSHSQYFENNLKLFPYTISYYS